MARDLGFPYGLHADADESRRRESWRHRLVSASTRAASAQFVADHLPGYPARLSPAEDGGAWLSVFAPRNRLIEFVLQETHYRHDMMRDVAPEYWIAPALASGRSFLEPLQCGGIKTMGVHKPWAPEPLLRHGGAPRPGHAAARSACTAARTAPGTAPAAPSSTTGGSIVASKGGDCIVAVDIAAAKGH